MFLEITFIILLIVGIVLIVNSYDYDSIGGWSLAIISIIVLIFNTIQMLTPSYDYEILLAERNSYQESLNQLREIDNEFETLAIGEDIIDFNQHIARQKVQNKSWFYDSYIDDRIETLEPIK